MQDPRHDPTPRLTHRGLEGKEISSPSSRGRKMSLTSPLIDQAFTLKIQPQSFSASLLEHAKSRQQLRFQFPYFRRGMIVFDVWTIEFDVQELAVQVEQVIV